MINDNIKKIIKKWSQTLTNDHKLIIIKSQSLIINTI